MPGPDNDEVAAEVLGYLSAQQMKELGADEAARRLGQANDIRPTNPEALRVLARVISAFIEEACVPNAGDIDALVEETDRIAGFATPLDPLLRDKAAEGLGLNLAQDSVAAVYGLCSKLTVFLFSAVLRSRGQIA